MLGLQAVAGPAGKHRTQYGLQSRYNLTTLANWEGVPHFRGAFTSYRPHQRETQKRHSDSEWTSPEGFGKV